MTRLFGYILGALSGLIFIGSFLILFYLLFVIAEDDKDSSFGEVLAVVATVVVFSFVVFFYVYQTGFGRSKVDKAKEELELIKLRQEIRKIKDSQ